MSDEPLFQNSDAQESAYAGEGADNDQSGRDGTDASGAGVVIPAAGFAGIGGTGMGGTGTTGTGGAGAGGAVGPALAGAALAGGLDDDDRDDARRDAADGANDAAGQTPSG